MNSSFEFTGSKSDFSFLEAIGAKEVKLPKKGLNVELVALEAVEKLVTEAKLAGADCKKIEAGLVRLKAHPEVQQLFIDRIIQAEKVQGTDCEELKSFLSSGIKNPVGFLSALTAVPLKEETLRILAAKAFAKIDARATAQYIRKFEILNLEALVEIAKLCLEEDPFATAEFIQNFTILDEVMRIEIAKLCAKRDGLGTAQLISHFRIRDERALVEIAKLAFLQNQEAAGCIKRFAIEEPSLLVEISKFLSIGDEVQFIHHLANFVSEEPLTMVTIAKEVPLPKEVQISLLRRAVELMEDSTDTLELLKIIQELTCDDEPLFIELMKSAIARTHFQEINEICQYIDNLKIQDPRVRLEIAKLCGERNLDDTIANIHAFALADPKDIVEIYTHSHALVVSHIKKISKLAAEIEEEEVRIALAKLCAKENGGRTAQFIRNFAIQDKKALREIAILSMESKCDGEPCIAMEFIDNFDITNKETFVDQILISAEHNGRETAKHIQKFGIKDEKILIEIAKRSALQNGNMAQFINRFGIKDKKALIEIAKLCFQTGDALVPECIYKFKIADDDEVIIELAKIYAKNPSGNLGETIGAFAAVKDWVEIVKIAAQYQAASTAQHIQKFGINDEEALIEIAKLCARGTVKGLENFGITEPQILLEILRISLQNDPEETVRRIPKMGLHNHDDICQILVLAIPRNPMGVAKILIRRPPIQNPEMIQDLLMVCYSYSPEAIHQISEFKNHPLSLINTHKGTPLYNRLAIGKIEDFLAQKSIGSSISLKKLKAPLEGLLKPVDKAALSSLSKEERLGRIQEEESLQQEKLALFISLIGYLENASLPIEEWPAILNLFPLVADSRRPNLKWPLLIHTVQFTVSNRSSSLPSQEPGWVSMVKILGERLISAEFPREKVELLMERCVESKLFKHGKNHQALEEMFIIFLEDNQIPSFVREHLIDKLREDLPKKIGSKLTRKEATDLGKSMAVLPDRIRQIVAILFLLNELPPITFDVGSLSIADLLQKLLKEIIPMEDIENFDDKFVKSFGSCRDPMAIIRYLARLNSLHDTAVMKDITTVFTEVLEGSWLTMRHDLTANPHLQKIAKSTPDLLNRWHTPCESFSLVEYKNRHPEGSFEAIQIPDSAVVVDTEEWIDLFMAGIEVIGSCQDLDGDPKLTKGLLGYLMDGKIRMIAIKSKEGPEGTIMARALIKLLWDGEKPVLFLEELYYSKKSSLYESAIVEMAKQKAAKLGIPLVSCSGKGSAHSLPLTSLGGPASFEYSDANKGIQAKGIYTIHKAKYVK